MFRKLKSRKLIFVGFAVTCLLGLWLFNTVSNALGLNFWNPSLVGDSSEQIGQYAINYAARERRIRSGTPQVALVKFVKPEDLPKLGLDPIELENNKNPSLVLVILKGDFGWGAIDGAVLASVMEQWRGTYISYLDFVPN